MQALITSYLVQKKDCDLPLLGHFRIKTKPADFEKNDACIFPPTDEILYSEFAASLSGELITYISVHQRITLDQALLSINDWCKHAREQLDLGEKINFESIGSLQKDAVGNIFFQRKKQPTFYDPVSAERVYKDAERSVSLVDSQALSLRINEPYIEAPVRKKIWWKIWAIALLSVSILALFFYFYTHGFSNSGTGGPTSLPVQDPPVLHRSL